MNTEAVLAVLATGAAVAAGGVGTVIRRRAHDTTTDEAGPTGTPAAEPDPADNVPEPAPPTRPAELQTVAVARPTQPETKPEPETAPKPDPEPVQASSRPETPMQTAPQAATDPTARWHHSKHLRTVANDNGTWTHTFTYISSWDRLPSPPAEMYHDPQLRQDNQRPLNQLKSEYDEAYRLWCKAHLDDECLPAVANLREAHPKRAAAQDMAQALFTEMLEGLPASMWPAQTLNLVRAHDALLAAAEAFDSAARRLVQAATVYSYGEGGWADTMKSYAGADLGTWDLDEYAYIGQNYGDGPVTRDAHTLINKQRKELKEVSELLGSVHLAEVA